MAGTALRPAREFVYFAGSKPASRLAILSQPSKLPAIRDENFWQNDKTTAVQARRFSVRLLARPRLPEADAQVQ